MPANSTSGMPAAGMARLSALAASGLSIATASSTWAYRFSHCPNGGAQRLYRMPYSAYEAEPISISASPRLMPPASRLAGSPWPSRYSTPASDSAAEAPISAAMSPARRPAPTTLMGLFASRGWPLRVSTATS